MLFIALLVVCAGAVHSQNDAELFRSDHDASHRSLEAPENGLITQQNNYETMEGLKNEHNIDTNSLNTMNMPNPFSTPKYSDALRNFNMFLEDIRLRLKNPSRNFLIIAGVLLGMAREMAGKSWAEYDAIYENEAPVLYEQARADPMTVIEDLNCVLTYQSNSIAELVNVIHSSYVQNFCEAKPDLCDNLIATIVETQPHLRLQGELLMVLSSYSELYIENLHELKKEEKVDEFSLFVWIVKSRNRLRRLIYIGSEIHSKSPNDCRMRNQYPRTDPQDGYLQSGNGLGKLVSRQRIYRLLM